MSARIEAYNLNYESYPDRGAGDRFARLDVTVDARVSGGYYGYDDNTGRIALYVHEPSGLVVTDRDDFLRWSRGLATKQYRDEEDR